MVDNFTAETPNEIGGAFESLSVLEPHVQAYEKARADFIDFMLERPNPNTLAEGVESFAEPIRKLKAAIAAKAHEKEILEARIASAPVDSNSEDDFAGVVAARAAIEVARLKLPDAEARLRSKLVEITAAEKALGEDWDHRFRLAKAPVLEKARELAQAVTKWSSKIGFGPHVCGGRDSGQAAHETFAGIRPGAFERSLLAELGLETPKAATPRVESVAH